MYLPFNRLERIHIGQAFGKRTPHGEKAVANYDEDSLTMAVSAAINCIGTKGSATALNGVYFASTTPPNREKQAAAHIASVLNVDGHIRTSDFNSTLRSGTNAMLAALDAARHDEEILVTAADCRPAYADSSYEISFGDGAAAFTFGNHDVIAEYIDSYSVSYDFYDVWCSSDEKYPHFFDEKFSLDKGYVPFTVESIKGLMKRNDITQEQIAKIVIDAPSDRHAMSILRPAGFSPGLLQESLIKDFGYTGTANALLLLACTLEKSRPGDLILYVSYGEGSDAVLFKVCENVNNIGSGRGLDYFKNNKKNDMNYEKYLKWKKMMVFDPPRRMALTRSNLPDFYRKRKKNLSCQGSKCTECGTPHYPPSMVCVKCKAIEKMEPYSFKGRHAKLATFAFDYVAFSEDSPNIVAVVDFEGGGRMFTYLMDCAMNDVVIGMPVELTYRKIFSVDGIHTYSWKCVPSNH